jgi:hypothetical protein
MPVTNTDLTIRMFVDDIATVIAAYNRIKVFRSIGNELGPWEEITGPALIAATLGGSETEPFLLNGLTLELTVDGVSPITVAFAGADPYTAAAAATDITTALGALGTASDDGTGKVRMWTTNTGTDASFEITGGTGYANLGFQLNQYDIGEDARITLSAGVQDYSEIDHNGSRDYWYRTRYYHTGTGAQSEYSTAFPGATVLKMPSTDLITGTVHLVDLRGNALPHQRISMYNLFEPSIRSTYGVFGMEHDFYTDEDGYGESVFVRGALVEVTFENTSVNRRIRVPTSGSEFDILDPTLAPDIFGISSPTYVWAERRSP